jgi:hypothetical protein
LNAGSLWCKAIFVISDKRLRNLDYGKDKSKNGIDLSARCKLSSVTLLAILTLSLCLLSVYPAAGQTDPTEMQPA